MAKKPHGDTRLANYLNKRLLELRPKKSWVEIAAEVGFINPNILTMLKIRVRAVPPALWIRRQVR